MDHKAFHGTDPLTKLDTSPCCDDYDEYSRLKVAPIDEDNFDGQQTKLRVICPQAFMKSKQAYGLLKTAGAAGSSSGDITNTSRCWGGEASTISKTTAAETTVEAATATQRQDCCPGVANYDCIRINTHKGPNNDELRHIFNSSSQQDLSCGQYLESLQPEIVRKSAQEDDKYEKSPEADDAIDMNTVDSVEAATPDSIDDMSVGDLSKSHRFVPPTYCFAQSKYKMEAFSQRGDEAGKNSPNQISEQQVSQLIKFDSHKVDPSTAPKSMDQFNRIQIKNQPLENNNSSRQARNAFRIGVERAKEQTSQSTAIDASRNQLAIQPVKKANKFKFWRKQASQNQQVDQKQDSHHNLENKDYETETSKDLDASKTFIKESQPNISHQGELAQGFDELDVTGKTDTKGENISVSMDDDDDFSDHSLIDQAADLYLKDEDDDVQDSDPDITLAIDTEQRVPRCPLSSRPHDDQFTQSESESANTASNHVTENGVQDRFDLDHCFLEEDEDSNIIDELEEMDNLAIEYEWIPQVLQPLPFKVPVKSFLLQACSKCMLINKAQQTLFIFTCLTARKVLYDLNSEVQHSLLELPKKFTKKVLFGVSTPKIKFINRIKEKVQQSKNLLQNNQRHFEYYLLESQLAVSCSEIKKQRAPRINDCGDNYLTESHMSFVGADKQIVSITPNIQTIKDFLTSVSFQERIEIVNQCCAYQKFSFFGGQIPLDLLKAEIFTNGFGHLYYKDNMIEPELNQRVSTLTERLKRNKYPIVLDKAEQMAILLFTHERQEVYTSLKKTMTGKGQSQTKQQLQFSDKEIADVAVCYAHWKKNYEQKVRRSYKWPVLQILLQFSLVKILMSKCQPLDKFMTQALQFMSVSVDQQRSCFVFNFEPPSSTPFSASQHLSLIESIKIFGIVRMELVKYIDLKTLTSSNKMTLMSQTNSSFKHLPLKKQERAQEYCLDFTVKINQKFSSAEKAKQRQSVQTSKSSHKKYQLANEALFRIASAQEKSATKQSPVSSQQVDANTKSQLSTILLQRKLEIQNRKFKLKNRTVKKTQEDPISSSRTLQEGFELKVLPTEAKLTEEIKPCNFEEQDAQEIKLRSPIAKKRPSQPKPLQLKPPSQGLKKPTALKQPSPNVAKQIPSKSTCQMQPQLKEVKQYKSRIPAFGASSKKLVKLAN